jgi:carbamoyl-phosphate synthase large subunit
MLPPQGAILLSIADRDKPEALPIIRQLADTGYKLYATEGTAATLTGIKLAVTMITKKLSEGHPNVVDVINGGIVQGVINTVSGSGSVLRDGFYIRRAAAERRIPCYTSLDTARVAVDALASGNPAYHIQPLTEYRKGSH